MINWKISGISESLKGALRGAFRPSERLLRNCVIETFLNFCSSSISPTERPKNLKTFCRGSQNANEFVAAGLSRWFNSRNSFCGKLCRVRNQFLAGAGKEKGRNSFCQQNKNKNKNRWRSNSPCSTESSMAFRLCWSCSRLFQYHSDCPTWGFREPPARPAAANAAGWSPETRRTSDCVACCCCLLPFLFTALDVVVVVAKHFSLSGFYWLCKAEIPLDCWCLYVCIVMVTDTIHPSLIVPQLLLFRSQTSATTFDVINTNRHLLSFSHLLVLLTIVDALTLLRFFRTAQTSSSSGSETNWRCVNVNSTQGRWWLLELLGCLGERR